MSVGFSRILFTSFSAENESPAAAKKRSWWRDLLGMLLGGQSAASRGLDQAYAREAVDIASRIRQREWVVEELVKRDLVDEEGDFVQGLRPAGALLDYCDALGLIEPRVVIEAQPTEVAPAGTGVVCPRCLAVLPLLEGRNPQSGETFPIPHVCCEQCGEELPDSQEPGYQEGKIAAFSVILRADGYDESTPPLRVGCANFVEAVEMALGHPVEERFLSW